ncbi:multicopper oxidase family protein [Streptosporangium sp. CA-135522]|uniref:multicopper oxidase family protein n=1 Tax=Streptosporangium sp. CA-135522 TaxID=3240072 RepID=UPI003D8B9662
MLGGLAAALPGRTILEAVQNGRQAGHHMPPYRDVALVRSGVLPPAPAFARPLLIPPVLRPTRRTMTTDYYQVAIKQGQAEVFPGIQTPVLGYEGRFTGPTIHAHAGRRVVVTQTNSLTEPAAVHLHGGHVPPDSDGHPMDVIAPGSSRTYVYPNNQLGATLWYHDHAHHLESEHVYRGLAGFYLLKDQTEASLPLPRGGYDVPLMFRDAQFDDQGKLLYANGGFRERTTVLVNGLPQPYFQVKARKYRLRLLNACNDRDLAFTMANGEFVQIGSDGGLLPAPVPTTKVGVWPGERVEVVVDFSRYPVGSQVVLVNERGNDEATRNVMRFDVVGEAPDFSSVPETLRPLPDLGEATVTRDVVFKLDLTTGMFLIDGKVFDPARVDQQVKRGTTEIWRISNPDTRPAVPHNMHLHLAQFQVLERNGRPVSGHEAGLKDTVTVLSGGTASFKVRFEEYTGRYVYHCHLLDHSSMGMMAQMEITP